MQKIIWTYFIIVLLITQSCEDEKENYPQEPSIEEVKISFINTPGNSTTDTLKLTINFTDGDFDLGLNSFEIDSPYHVFDFFVDQNGKTEKVAIKPNPSTNYSAYLVIKTNKPGKLITYGYTRKYALSLPDFSCNNYALGMFTVSASNKNLID